MSVNLTTNLKAFYKLDNSLDSSGNEIDLILQNSNATFISGKVGNAIEILGNDWLTSGTRHELSQGFTVSCWVNINSSNSLRPAVSQWQGGYGAFYIGTANEQYVFATCHDQDVANPTWLYGGTAALNQWVHMVGVYDGTTEKLYINGSLIASQSTNALADSSVGDFKIASLDAGGEFVFDGIIDAVGLWDRALNTEEVAALYNSGTGVELTVTPTVALTNGLEAFYKLDSVSDSSGNNRALTNNGGVSFSSGKVGNAADFLTGKSLSQTSPFSSPEFTVAGWVKISHTETKLTSWWGGYEDSIISLCNDINNTDSSPMFEVCYMSEGAAGQDEFGDRLRLWNGQSQFFAGSTVGDGQWHFFAVRVKGNTWKMRVDSYDNLMTSYSLADQPSNLFLRMGRARGETDNLEGSIDAVGIWNRALNSAEIAALYNSGTGVELTVTLPVNLNSGLQAFYKLDDTSDSSGNGYTLTNNGNPTFSTGKVGNAVQTSEEDYLVVPSGLFNNINDEFTISAFLNINQTSIDKWSTWGFFDFGSLVEMGVENGQLRANFFGPNVYSGIQEIANEWINIAVTASAGTLRMYRNGSLVASTQAGTKENASLNVGFLGGNSWSPGYFDGQIDAVGIWNRALNNAEIAALYNSGNGLEEFGGAPTVSFVKIQGNAKFFGNVKFVS
jgi:hypothetical protein